MTMPELTVSEFTAGLGLNRLEPGVLSDYKFSKCDRFLAVPHVFVGNRWALAHWVRESRKYFSHRIKQKKPANTRLTGS